MSQGSGAMNHLKQLAFEKVLLYLKFMKKKIISVDKANYSILISETVPYVPSEKIKVGIMFPGSWVRIFTILYDNFDIEMLGANAVEVLVGMLRLQDEYMEFTFSLSKGSELVIKEDIHVGALTYDVFEEEYNAILEAYKKFYKNIVPLIKEARELTAERMVEIW